LDLDKHGPVPTASDSDFVICPECGSEFQPHVKICIDCGAATAPAGAARAPAQGSAEAGPPGEGAEEIVIRTEELEWIENLQELFERHGISSRIEALPSSPSPHRPHRCQILVARQDAVRAFALDGELLRQQLGDEGDELTEIPPPGICPYCRSTLPAGAVECPGCGLILASSNLEIVQGLYKAFEAQDRDQILAIFDPEIEWIQNEGFPGGGRYVGAETVLDEVFARLGRDWKAWQADVGRWLVAGESIVALGAYQGTHRTTGRSMTAAFAHVYWLYDGRVVRFEQYADTAKVAAACGDG
jgi:ketosteroid isomerase-like protein